MKYKKIILIVLYSILFIPIFGLLMLDNSTKSNISVFICLIYTFYSGFIVSKEFNTFRNSKLIILIFPVFYLILSFFAKNINIYSLLNPILISNLFLLSSLYVFKEINSKKVFFFYVFFAYFYAFILFQYWEKSTIIKSDFQEIVEKKYLNEDIDLQDFKFLNHNADTLKIESEKYTLIETWNENCPPCLKSIKDLEPIIDSLDTTLSHIYMYESKKFKTENNFNEVINFKHINQKNKIFIDYNQSFFNKTGMISYPVFLLFDENGKLVDYFTGYNSAEKIYFKNRIINMAKTATNNVYN